MLSLNYIRENNHTIIAGLKKRQFKPISIIDEIMVLDQKRRNQKNEIDNILAQANQKANEIGMLFKQGKTEEADKLKSETVDFKEKSKILQESLQQTTAALNDLRTKVPNIPHDLVPNGTSEKDNEIVFTEGEIPKLANDALPHWELASQYGLIDFELGSKITGAGFPVYKGKGARLQRALINYFLDKNTAAGYREMQVPHLVNTNSGFGTGQLPDKEGQMYRVPDDDLFLIPTAEVPLTNLYRNQLLQANELPICLTGYTPCYRREAGSYGTHVRGLNRLHQFDKVEIVRIEEPQNASAALDGMVNHVKRLLVDLQMPFRILRLCAGDLGFTAALTYDFEIFSTAQNRWLEISSVSTFDSFQAERLQLRYKNKKGKKQLLHTLNGSALALPRIVAGLLENCQSPKGIKIPDVLVPYTGFEWIN